MRWSQIVGVNVEQWPDLRVRWLPNLTMTSPKFANEWGRKSNGMVSVIRKKISSARADICDVRPNYYSSS